MQADNCRSSPSWRCQAASWELMISIRSCSTTASQTAITALAYFLRYCLTRSDEITDANQLCAAAAQKLPHLARVTVTFTTMEQCHLYSSASDRPERTNTSTALHGPAARAGCSCNALLGLAEHIAFMHHNVLLP